MGHLSDPGRRGIDLNADLGEEITDDAGLLAVVSSANVACGYHAGTLATMRSVCAEAARLGVRIGAQVSYADRAGFGRVELEVDPDVLSEQIADQVGTLSAIAAESGTAVAYVRPHGALYHRVTRDPIQARAVLAGSGRLPVLALPGALVARLAREDGREAWREGFADRALAADGSLVPRGRPGAVITDPDRVAQNAVRTAAQVDSLCVHGDTPGAVALAGAVRRALETAGLEVRPVPAPGSGG